MNIFKQYSGEASLLPRLLNKLGENEVKPLFSNCAINRKMMRQFLNEVKPLFSKSALNRKMTQQFFSLIPLFSERNMNKIEHVAYLTARLRSRGYSISTDIASLTGCRPANRGARCPVRDNIWVEHVAYLTARPNSRGYSISTDIASLTGCCSVRNVNGYFILSAFLISNFF